MGMITFLLIFILYIIPATADYLLLFRQFKDYNKKIPGEYTVNDFIRYIEQSNSFGYMDGLIPIVNIVIMCEKTNTVIIKPLKIYLKNIVLFRVER